MNGNCDTPAFAPGLPRNITASAASIRGSGSRGSGKFCSTTWHAGGLGVLTDMGFLLVGSYLKGLGKFKLQQLQSQ